MQGTRAARAGKAVDIDHALDPRQVGGQRPTVRTPLGPPRLLLGRFILLVGKARGLDLLGLLQPKQELILRQALGAAAKPVALHG
jgi:hypothetical protein